MPRQRTYSNSRDILFDGKDMVERQLRTESGTRVWGIEIYRYVYKLGMVFEGWPRRCNERGMEVT
jgi:hypothetical protein